LNKIKLTILWVFRVIYFGSIGGSRLKVGMDGGGVIDDVVNNGFSSYNTDWLGRSGPN